MLQHQIKHILRPLNHRIDNQNQVSQSQITQPTHQVTAAEIEAMGGKVSAQQSQSRPYTQTTTQQQRLTTDDEIGNGESIFDF
ncbi:Uncharacterised protein [Staphylococcus argenteus]|nr:Uncharacterised protein [Staphylococcus argenteus]